MNTQSVLTRDANLFYDQLCRLMVDDGFGPDEALCFKKEYAQCIFSNYSPTAVLRVEQALTRMIRNARTGG